MKWKGLLLIAGILGIILWNYNYFESPESTLDQFAMAHNDADVLQMIELVDPSQTREITGMIKIAGAVSEAFIGTDIVDLLLPILPSIAGFIESETGEGMPKLSFQYEDTNMNLLRTEAQILVNSIMTYPDGSEAEQQGVVYLEKIDKKWFIMDMHDVERD